jgi:hypothetical protein
MTIPTNKAIKITWVHKGTNRAAGIGRDETIPYDCEQSDGNNLEQAELDAEYAAECRGIDLKQYEPIAEIIDNDD